MKKPGKDQRKSIKLSAQVNPVVPPVSALVPLHREPVPGPNFMVSRETARSRAKTTGQILFEIPKEVESIELVY